MHICIFTIFVVTLYYLQNLIERSQSDLGRVNRQPIMYSKPLEEEQIC